MIELNKEQQSILSLLRDRDAIITGPAGTGKTIAAIYLADALSKEGKVLFVVFTKSLKAFVIHELKGLNNTFDKITISTSESARRESQKFDFIIIDEVQDFSLEDINEYNFLKRGAIYLFGDSQQQLYSQNLRGQKNIDIKSLLEDKKYISILLTKNCRNTRQISELIQELFPSKNFLRGRTDSDEKIVIRRFPDIEKELEFLTNFILTTPYEKVGVLLERNDSCVDNFMGLNISRLGILELAMILKEKNIEFGYKYRKDIDELDLNKKVNILTYHSAKGLDFDCVILPFLTGVHDLPSIIKADNPFYVALTRSRQKSVLTCNVFADEKLNKLSLNKKIYDCNQLEFVEDLYPAIEMLNILQPILSGEKLIQAAKRVKQS